MKYTKQNETNKKILLTKLRAYEYQLRKNGYDVEARAPLRSGPGRFFPHIAWAPSQKRAGEFSLVYRYLESEKSHTLELSDMSLAQLADVALNLEHLMRQIGVEIELMQARIRTAIETVDFWLKAAEYGEITKQDSE